MENFAEEALGGMPRITVSGGSEVKIEGVSGIFCLTDSAVGFRCGRRTVSISGSGLRLLFVRGSDAAVEGEIGAVEFGTN